jgi:hypothetical protein
MLSFWSVCLGEGIHVGVRAGALEASHSRW